MSWCKVLIIFPDWSGAKPWPGGSFPFWLASAEVSWTLVARYKEISRKKKFKIKKKKLSPTPKGGATGIGGLGWQAGAGGWGPGLFCFFLLIFFFWIRSDKGRGLGIQPGLGCILILFFYIKKKLLLRKGVIVGHGCKAGAQEGGPAGVNWFLANVFLKLLFIYFCNSHVSLRFWDPAVAGETSP
jgi:hypothetical protein